MHSLDGPYFEDASCKSIADPLWDLEVFGETKHQRVNRHMQAKKICRDCPVMLLCRRWAECHNDDAMGVWGGKIYSPDQYKYPRCDMCDRPLAVTMTAVYRLSSGYVLPHPANVAICVDCGVVAGLAFIAVTARLDGVKYIVENVRSFKITKTVTQLSEPRPTKRAQQLLKQIELTVADNIDTV